MNPASCQTVSQPSGVSLLGMCLAASLCLCSRLATLTSLFHPWAARLQFFKRVGRQRVQSWWSSEHEAPDGPLDSFALYVPVLLMERGRVSPPLAGALQQCWLSSLLVKDLNESLPRHEFSSNVTFIKSHPDASRTSPLLESKLPGWALEVIDSAVQPLFWPFLSLTDPEIRPLDCRHISQTCRVRAQPWRSHPPSHPPQILP